MKFFKYNDLPVPPSPYIKEGVLYDNNCCGLI